VVVVEVRVKDEMTYVAEDCEICENCGDWGVGRNTNGTPPPPPPPARRRSEASASAPSSAITRSLSTLSSLPTMSARQCGRYLHERHEFGGNAMAGGRTFQPKGYDQAWQPFKDAGCVIRRTRRVLKLLK
jgi:hypothetical protein